MMVVKTTLFNMRARCSFKYKVKIWAAVLRYAYYGKLYSEHIRYVINVYVCVWTKTILNGTLVIDLTFKHS